MFYPQPIAIWGLPKQKPQHHSLQAPPHNSAVL